MQEEQEIKEQKQMHSCDKIITEEEEQQFIKVQLQVQVRDLFNLYIRSDERGKSQAAYFLKITKAQNSISLQPQDFSSVQVDKIKQYFAQLRQITLVLSTIYEEELKLLLTFTPNLQELQINTPQCLKTIKLQNLPKLKVLQISHTKVFQPNYFTRIKYKRFGGQGFKFSYPPLKFIELINLPLLKKCTIHRFAVQQITIEEMPLLQNLEVSRCDSLKSIEIKNCKKIKRLIFNKSSINNAHLQQINLNEFLFLKSLELNGCKHLNKLFLKDLSNLISIDLSKSLISQVILRSLKRLSALNLSLYTNVKSIDIFQCPSIKCLTMHQSGIKNSMIQSFFSNQTSFSKLQQINLTKSRYQNYQINHIKLPKLRKLNIKYSLTTSLILDSCPELKEVNLSYCKNMKHLQLKGCQKLKKLDMSYFSLKCQNNKQPNLEQLLCFLPSLQQLDLTLCKIKLSVNNRNNFQLQSHLKLQRLTLSYSDIQNLKLQNIPNLKHLNLSNCFSLNLFSFIDCKSIEKLYIKQSGRNGKLSNVSNLSQNQFLNLKYLRLEDNAISNIQALSLLNFQIISELYIQKNRITSIKPLAKINKFSKMLNVGENLILSHQPLTRSNFKERSLISNQRVVRSYLNPQILKIEALSRLWLRNQAWNPKMKESIQKRFPNGKVSFYY